MDAVIGLGHFCETHGPCIILSTQRCQEEPNRCSVISSTPWCESCQSIDSDQSLISSDKDTHYVTTRAPLSAELSGLLRQAAVRSLSCEETSKEGGTMYFGDCERGHVISHTFTLQDSLARGFHRKYSIVILNFDKLDLMNAWPMLSEHVREIACDLQKKAVGVNEAEQTQYFQRALRHAQGSPTTSARSLSQLTGEPAIFGHLHMWFTWLLSIEPIIQKLNAVPDIPIICNAESLKSLYNKMDPNVFRTLCFCILTGIRIEGDEHTKTILAQMLPTNWHLPKSGEPCKLQFSNGNYSIEWNGNLPSRLPSLLTMVEKALTNEMLKNSALQHHLTSMILHWKNISRVLSEIPVPNQTLFQAMGVQKFDMPLLAYWTSQCRQEALS